MINLKEVLVSQKLYVISPEALQAAHMLYPCKLEDLDMPTVLEVRVLVVSEYSPEVACCSLEGWCRFIHSENLYLSVDKAKEALRTKIESICSD